MEHPDAGAPVAVHHPPDLAAALARARSPRRPGAGTGAGTAVLPWPGAPTAIPEAGPDDLDLAALLRLSLAASDPGGRLRPASSAGALHPVDTVLVVGAGCSLPPGRYGYDPLRHRVHRLGPKPDGTPPGVRAELSVTAQRTVAHYGHRAWPLLLLDTGHAAAALYLAARALGAGEPGLRLDGLTASPLAAVHIPPPTRESHGRAGFPPAVPPLHSADMPPAARPAAAAPTSAPEELLETAAPTPGELPAAAVPTPGELPAAAVPTPDELPPAAVPTPDELLARRSDPPPLTGAPPPDALRRVLATAVRAGGQDLRWCAAVGPPRPGLVEMADGTALRRFAAGEARPALAAWAAGQAWIADAGAVLLARGCPSDADTPHILRTHLRAGFAVHLAHVTARRLGLTARPVGSWQQADLGAALGAPPGQDWIVHGLALGTFPADEENRT
ncbi:SagB/ThcOx family dehydrogenase [Streptomyces sp. NPDC058657]|uniref:SagB/ThcOx family dehydrogenase n=1 Tax=unclassified Streptomyces TaxID=2593676 RepID=UPI0036578AC7